MMRKSVNCAYCKGTAELKHENKETIYRKESFKFNQFYYKCNSCKDEFTTNDIDDISVNQIYNQYREKHNLIFPEELVSLREQYVLSAVKMSQVLGLGINTYSNYEKGEVPSLSNSNLIKSAKNPSFFLTLLVENVELFSENNFTKIHTCVQNLISKKDVLDYETLGLDIIDKPSSFTGYIKPNLNKISNLILFYISKCKSEFNDKLKLNKLLFFTDFSYYKNYGKSVTGLSYRAIQYGPIPSCYDNLFGVLTHSKGLIDSNFIRSSENKAYEVFSSSNKYDMSCFIESEFEQINIILDKFKDSPTWDLVDLSHQEKAWFDLSESKELIDYQKYAIELEAF